MQIPLTRIEYEYIFETFTEVQPPLFLQIGTFFYTVNPSSYRIKDACIYFTAPDSLQNKTAVIFFEHKKRSISFYAHIKIYKQAFFIRIPLVAYKYDPEVQKGNGVTAALYLPNTPPITVYEHKYFPLDSIAYTNAHFHKQAQPASGLYQSILQCIEPDNAATAHSLPLFLYRIYEFEQRTAILFNPQEGAKMLALFIDNRILICGCKRIYTTLFKTHLPIRVELCFPHRIIRILKASVVFSHCITMNDISIIGFQFDELFEEDKRFLYENIYHQKYNPAYLRERNRPKSFGRFR